MGLTFRNLKFRPHRNDKKSIAATLEIKPKVFISVVAGPGLYSLPGGTALNKTDKFDEYPDSNDFSSFEVGIIDENLDAKLQEFKVIGWQSRDEINNIIRKTING